MAYYSIFLSSVIQSWDYINTIWGVNMIWIWWVFITTIFKGGRLGTIVLLELRQHLLLTGITTHIWWYRSITHLFLTPHESTWEIVVITMLFDLLLYFLLIRKTFNFLCLILTESQFVIDTSVNWSRYSEYRSLWWNSSIKCNHFRGYTRGW